MIDWLYRVFSYTPLERELLASKDDNTFFRKYGSMVEVDGVSLFVVDAPAHNETKIPQLPPLILVHGLGGCTLTFKYLAKMLNRFARVIIMDLPGHGNSPDPRTSAGFKPEYTAQLLTSLITKLCENEDFVLIGHSYGTSHAFRVANGKLSNRCKGVVAVTPSYNMNLSSTQRNVAGYLPGVIFDVAIRANDRKGELHSASVNRHFTQNASERARKDQLQTNLLSRTYSVLQSVYYGRFYDIKKDGLPSCPVLIIGAIADEVCPVKKSRELQADLKRAGCNSMFIEVRNAGHGIMFERSEVVDGIISKFIKDAVDERLSMAWQLQFIASHDNKWSLKNEAKWKNTKSVGENVEGLKGMKVLREQDDEHGPSAFEEAHPEIGAIIDISREAPPYDPKSFKRVKYQKFPTVSKIPPSKDEVKGFIKLVKDLRAKIGDDAIIGVHCHYGFNRTGFFIVSYLIEEKGYTVDDALAAYKKSRDPGIRHQHFVDELHMRYSL